MMGSQIQVESGQDRRKASLFGIGTIAFLFTIPVQNLNFTEPVGLANPTKQCESLAEGSPASD